MAQSSTYAYNGLGLNTKMTDRNGSVFSYGYDEHNQLTSDRSVSAGGNVSTEYKYLYIGAYGVNGISEYNNGIYSGETSYSINSSGRIAEKVTWYNASTYSSYLKNGYDRMGRLTNNAICKDGVNYFSTNYMYTNTRLNKVQTNGAQAVDPTGQAYAVYNYYPDGKLESVAYPTLSDGTTIKTSYVYDKLNRLQTITNKKGSTVLSQYTYTYDANGNATTITDNVSNKCTQYNYDKLDRLQEVNNPDRGIITYTYDLRGNRKTLSGSITLDLEPATYSYDLRNRLTQATKGSVTTSISYNPEGLRYKKSTPSNTVQYHYNMNGEVIAEGDSTGSIKADYVWGPDRTLVKKDTATGNNYYYLYNGHGDVVQIVDATGNIVNNYSYDEWGNILNKTETTSNPFTYAGEIYDSETGLYYLRTRYYDPATSRMLTEDSYPGDPKDPLSLNLYTYCNNDPVNHIDPSGHVVETIIDAASIGWSAYDLWTNPSWGNFGFLAWDVAATIIPIVPGSWTVKGIKAGTKLLSKADDVVDTTKKVGKGVKNPKVKNSTEVGKEAHRQLEADGIDQWIPEQNINLPDGTKVRKDGVGRTDSNKVRIIKPDTLSGRAAAQKRADKMRNNKYDPTIDYYNPADPRYQPGSPFYIGPKK